MIVQCSSDKVLLTSNEILILPDDYKRDLENWIQDSIINKNPEKIYHSKTDSQRLAKFLLEEQRNTWGNPKTKCKLHNQRCDLCDPLYRSTSRRECKLIQNSWDAVTSKEASPGKNVITHTYQ